MGEYRRKKTLSTLAFHISQRVGMCQPDIISEPGDMNLFMKHLPSPHEAYNPSYIQYKVYDIW